MAEFGRERVAAAAAAMDLWMKARRFLLDAVLAELPGMVYADACSNGRRMLSMKVFMFE